MEIGGNLVVTWGWGVSGEVLQKRRNFWRKGSVLRQGCDGCTAHLHKWAESHWALYWPWYLSYTSVRANSLVIPISLGVEAESSLWPPRPGMSWPLPVSLLLLLFPHFTYSNHMDPLLLQGLCSDCSLNVKHSSPMYRCDSLTHPSGPSSGVTFSEKPS